MEAPKAAQEGARLDASPPEREESLEREWLDSLRKRREEQLEKRDLCHPWY